MLHSEDQNNNQQFAFTNRSNFFDLYENIDANIELDTYITQYEMTENEDILSLIDIIAP